MSSSTRRLPHCGPTDSGAPSRWATGIQFYSPLRPRAEKHFSPSRRFLHSPEQSNASAYKTAKHEENSQIHAESSRPFASAVAAKSIRSERTSDRQPYRVCPLVLVCTSVSLATATRLLTTSLVCTSVSLTTATRLCDCRSDSEIGDTRGLKGFVTHSLVSYSRLYLQSVIETNCTSMALMVACYFLFSLVTWHIDKKKLFINTTQSKCHYCTYHHRFAQSKLTVWIWNFCDAAVLLWR